MKETINYYYNLNLKEVEKWDSIYTFTYNNNPYYFVPLKRVTSELKDIFDLSQELKNLRIPIPEFIPNKYQSFLTLAYNTNYILLKPEEDIYKEYDLLTILKINNTLTLNPKKSSLYRMSWPKLWSDKIDYFEYQIKELGQNKPLILDSFSYYIGLGENAISYANNAITKYTPTPQDKICLSHRRIKFPNYSLNYLNPLSFIFDLEVRDLAEYLKSAFFSNEPALNYLNSLLKHKNFTIYSSHLLYARLLYPTYYFDLYEEIMNNAADEELLIPIIEKAESYETFLKEAYNLLNKYVPMERIEWILKES